MFILDTRSWQAHPTARTAALPLLLFDVSLNEEHIFLQLVLPFDTVRDLGERAHHYCLLTLARARLRDARRGIDPSAQGWIAVDDLAQMLGIDTGHLNIQIHRARRHVDTVVPPATNTASLIERRRGEIRFGPWQFRIVRGSALEGESSVPAVERRRAMQQGEAVIGADVRHGVTSSRYWP